ncbi:MAG: hypothetical protein AAGA28_17245 [Pseudomonadota bacterium]
MTATVLHATALGKVSKSLQELHQLLLRFQAHQSGFNEGPLQLFDRVTKDSAFAWLKPLRETIVALDERRTDPEPITDAEHDALRRQCRDLLNMKSGPLAVGLKSAFQSDPETIWAMTQLRKLLGTAG